MESREKTLAKLKKVKERFKEEKENEDAWPGHEGTFLQQLEADRDLLLNHLRLIENELKKLGYEVVQEKSRDILE